MDDHNGPGEPYGNPGPARRRLLSQAGAAALVAAMPRPARAQGASVATEPPPDLARAMADYAAGLRYGDLPPDIVRIVKRTVMDTVGCAFAGCVAGPSRIAVRLAQDVTARQPATVLVDGTRTSAERAAFADGVMIRYLDLNDAYVSRLNGPGHPSDTLAALLAAAEVGGRSGQDLIAATVLAYEIYCKVADVFDYTVHGIDHTTVTGMAAVVGAARLMGLTPDQAVQAIGITVGGNTATRQGRSDALSNWKAYAAADACRKALFSVQLAQDGMTGPNRVFDGSYGFFKVMSRTPVASPHFGEPYGIRAAFTKRFPLGQFSQTVAQAAVEARATIPDPSDIASVTVNVSRAAIRIMADGPDKWHPQTHETADHSIPYSAALALTYGRIDPDFYEDPFLHDPQLMDLVGRIRVVPLPEADRPDLANLCVLDVALKSGEHRVVRVENHRGHFKNPMTDAEMEEKFRLSAAKHLPPARVDALVDALWHLEQQPRVADLVALTVKPA